MSSPSSGSRSGGSRKTTTCPWFLLGTSPTSKMTEPSRGHELLPYLVTGTFPTSRRVPEGEPTSMKPLWISAGRLCAKIRTSVATRLTIRNDRIVEHDPGAPEIESGRSASTGPNVRSFELRYPYRERYPKASEPAGPGALPIFPISLFLATIQPLLPANLLCSMDMDNKILHYGILIGRFAYSHNTTSN